jgi:4a-hydroxytetrahydrobiopterin dehydratase
MPEAPQPLTDEQIAAALAGLPGWERAGDTIQKVYKFERYLYGLAFATTVGTVAEGMDHHPDILIQWRKVTVIYYTHAAGNKISQKDIDAAAAIEALPYKPRV